MDLLLLFDESLPHPLRDSFLQNCPLDVGVDFVQEKAWTSYENGDLLEQAQQNYDIFITGDTNIHEHTDLTGYEISTIILHAPTNRLEDLKPLLPEVFDVIRGSKKFKLEIIRSEDFTDP